MAVRAGVKPKEFYHMTPREVQICIVEAQKKEKRDIEMLEYEAWLHGIYVMNAIGCSISKNKEYPPNPLLEADLQTKSNGVMTDGERFALFASKHNRSMKRK